MLNETDLPARVVVLVTCLVILGKAPVEPGSNSHIEAPGNCIVVRPAVIDCHSDRRRARQVITGLVSQGAGRIRAGVGHLGVGIRVGLLDTTVILSVCFSLDERT